MTRISQRVENFNNAYDIYQEAVEAFDKDKKLSHMALIQSFEICLELAWKILKDYLFIKGVEAYFPKDVVKEAFRCELIPNGQIWIDMLEARNFTSHEYNMDKVDNLLIKMSTEFFEELNNFQHWIKNENL